MASNQKMQENKLALKFNLHRKTGDQFDFQQFFPFGPNSTSPIVHLGWGVKSQPLSS